MTVTPEDVHVVSSPSLNEGGEECRRKAEHKTDKPVDIYPDVRSRRADIRDWKREIGSVRDLCTERSKLVGDLMKQHNRLLLEVRRLLDGILLYVLSTIDDKCSEGSGKQASLI